MVLLFAIAWLGMMFMFDRDPRSWIPAGVLTGGIFFALVIRSNRK